MKSLLSFDDAGASDSEPVKGITQGDIRGWHDAERALLACLVDAHIMVSESRAQLAQQQSETARLEELNAQHRRSLMQLQHQLRESADL